VVKPSNGWYSKVDEDGVVEEKKYRIKDTETKDFWMPILKQKSFRDFIENKYRVAAGEIMQGDIDEAFDVETMNGTEA
jgi:hypothetical protein